MRYTQPQSGPVQVDWSNPITRGLISAIDGFSGRDILAGAASADSTTLGAGTSGVGRAFSATTYATFPFKRAVITNKCSYFVLLDLDGATLTGNSFIFGDVEAGSVGYNAGLYSNSSNFLFFIKTGGAGTNIASSTLSAQNFKRLRLAGTYDGATMRQYVNGVQDGSGAKTGNVDAGAFSLNLNRWNASSGFLGRSYLGLVWNRDLSAAENASLAANPWQLFRSPQRVMLVAAGGPDVTVALTGQGLTSARGTLGPSATVPVAGSSATVARGTIAPSLSLAVSGQSAAASRGTVAPAVSVGIAGQSAQASKGAVSVSGTADVTVALSGQAMTASRGALAPSTAKALTGQAQSAQRGLLAPARAIVISGQSSTVQRGSVSPSNNVTVALVGRAITAAQGSIAAFAASAAKFNQTTIMRATVTNRSSAARATSIAASSTMRSTFLQSTIMRFNPLNATATMSDAAINRTANLL